MSHIDPERQAAHGGPALEQPDDIVAALRDRERVLGRPVPLVVIDNEPPRRPLTLSKALAVLDDLTPKPEESKP